MLVKLNIESDPQKVGEQEFSNLLNTTEEVLDEGRALLEKMTEEVIKTMSGEESTIVTQADIIIKLNELPIEVVLLAAMVGLNEISNVEFNKRLQLSFIDPLNQTLGCEECIEDPCEESCENKEETKIIKLNPETK